jgi:hypothetical protein
MNERIAKAIVQHLIGEIDIPPSAYEKAEARYKDLGEWFERPESHCSKFDPHIYPQGSFRLGTVNRPIHANEAYDLDFGCRLRSGITKETHTQRELKELVGLDLEAYRKARQIQNELEEKHRCWRLEYADQLSFHMDGVPSIPESQVRKQLLIEAMKSHGTSEDLARSVARFAGAITDNSRLPHYNIISPDWLISNSTGFALWFESRMKLARRLLEHRALTAGKATVDELPARDWSSPLQQSIKLLKRHRDLMFQDYPEGKPISVIITTLAGLAYQGEADVVSAMKRILADMGDYVNSEIPKVPNPVNPIEDFADKWSMPQYAEHDLERNFWRWLIQAREDFALLTGAGSPAIAELQAKKKYGVVLPVEFAAGLFPATPVPETPPHIYVINEKPARPWCRI